MTDEVLARFGAARLWAAHRAPYLATAVFALKPVVLEPCLDERTGEPVPDPQFRAFPTDARWNVHVETGTALATPVEEIGWWLLHHVGHLVRAHAARSPEDVERWNQAADAEINDDLEAEGLPGPAGVISPAALGLPPNRMAEERLRPKVNWRAQLGSTLRRGVRSVAGRVDFSYRRTSRRAGAHPDIVTPAMIAPAPDIAVVVDTSGSVTKPRLHRLIAEVGGVLNGIAGPDPRRTNDRGLSRRSRRLGSRIQA